MEKRSEFVRRRTDHWQGEFKFQSANAAQRAELDAQAAEAAGIAWKPEAPALPERIEVHRYPGHIGGDLWPADHHKRTTRTLAARMALLDEAVRRYNAHTALRTLIARGQTPDPDSYAGAILAILDGPGE